MNDKHVSYKQIFDFKPTFLEFSFAVRIYSTFLRCKNIYPADVIKVRAYKF